MAISFSFSVVSALGATSATPSAAGAEAGALAARDFALDGNGNLLLVNGDLVMLTGADAVASDLQSRLQTFQGEVLLDSRIGLPWATEILGKQSIARVGDLLRAAILETPGVATLDAFEMSRSSDRQLRVGFRVTTDFGEIIEATLEA